jgi:hypothetical protein
MTSHIHTERICVPREEEGVVRGKCDTGMSVGNFPTVANIQPPEGTIHYTQVLYCRVGGRCGEECGVV